MKASEAQEGKLYRLPSRQGIIGDCLGPDATKTFCKFLIFTARSERKVIIIPMNTEIEEKEVK